MNNQIDLHDPLLRRKMSQPEWSVPEGYFDNLPERMKHRLDSIGDSSMDPLEQQRLTLLALAHITAIDQIKTSEFDVPENYFDKAQEVIVLSTSGQKKPSRIVAMRPIWWSSIAASIAVLIAFFALNKSSDTPPAFDQLLAEVNLTDDDLEWIADEEELADLYLEELEMSATDSILPDSTNKQLAPLDTLQTAPNSKTPKSSGPTKKIDWESISDDEIWEYLMESGDADELIDL